MLKFYGSLDSTVIPSWLLNIGLVTIYSIKPMRESLTPNSTKYGAISLSGQAPKGSSPEAMNIGRGHPSRLVAGRRVMDTAVRLCQELYRSGRQGGRT